MNNYFMILSYKMNILGVETIPLTCNGEFEVRFQNVRLDTFYRVKNTIEKMTPSSTYSHTIDTYHQNKIRITIKDDGTKSAMIKEELFSKDIRDYQIKVSCSSERNISIPPNIGPSTFQRDKQRWTYMFDKIKIDFTIVDDGGKFIKYEIEIECTTNCDINVLNTSAEIILKQIQDTDVIYSYRERNQILHDWNVLMKSQRKQTLDSSVMVQARYLKKYDLTSGGIDSGCSITHKCHGIGRCLYFHQTGIWLIYPPMYFTKISNQTIDKYVGVCIVGEIIPFDQRNDPTITQKYFFVPYDALSWVTQSRVPTSNIQNTHHITSRLKACKVISNLQVPNMIIRMKPFIEVGTTPETFVNAYMSLKSQSTPYKTDGFIVTPYLFKGEIVPFNPQSNLYSLHCPDNLQINQRILKICPDVCKVKPWNELTLDLLVKNKQIYVNQQVEEEEIPTPVLFTGTDRFSFTNVEWTDLKIDNDMIVEFKPIKNGNVIMLSPSRIRYDKTNPNRIDVAQDIWNLINDPLKEETLQGTDFERLYVQNNNLKREIFQSINVDCILVDLGSGRGGDLPKWKRNFHIKYIICVEPNIDNYNELVKRIEFYNMNNVIPINTGAEDTPSILNKLPKSNLPIIISMMLSLSFFWKDQQTLSKLQHTLSSLSPAKFLYYTIDGERTKQLFSAKGNNITFGTAGTMKFDPPNTVFIDLKDSIVTEQIEYLVNIDDLKCLINITKKDTLIESYLTENEKTFGNLFIHGTADIIKVEPQVKVEKIELVPNTNYVRISGGSFIYAVLNGVSPSFQQSDNKEEFERSFRNDLASLMIGNPPYAELMNQLKNYPDISPQYFKWIADYLKITIILGNERYGNYSRSIMLYMESDKYDTIGVRDQNELIRTLF